MFKLHFSTIQTVEYNSRRVVSSINLRREKDAEMQEYRTALSQGRIRAGDPIVRHFSTIDAKTFVIEQRLSISIHIDGKDWTSKFDPCLIALACGLRYRMSLTYL